MLNHHLHDDDPRNLVVVPAGQGVQFRLKFPANEYVPIGHVLSKPGSGLVHAYPA